jgi:hypothetical protein
MELLIPNTSNQLDLASIQRISTYEIRDDDAVTPNHTLSGLPYFPELIWRGSQDVEWLVLDGNFSHYEIDYHEKNSVTFFDLQDWLNVVYRTRNFVQRTPDQINFCVIGTNSQPWSTTAKVHYPANYGVQIVTPPGYSIPADGEIAWNFGLIDQFMVDVTFSGLGPDRPLLDLPFDYHGRTEDSIASLMQLFMDERIVCSITVTQHMKEMRNFYHILGLSMIIQ